MLVGDVEIRLPSVGAGAVTLGDVIASGSSDRDPADRDLPPQAAESQIVVSAHRINRGELPDLDTPATTSDFYFIAREDPEAARATIVELVAERIPARVRARSADRRRPGIDAAMQSRRARQLTAAVNRALQERLNPGVGGAEIVRGDRAYRRGDKVMQLRNDYDRAVFNGDIGVIEMVDPDAGVIPRRLR